MLVLKQVQRITERGMDLDISWRVKDGENTRLKMSC